MVSRRSRSRSIEDVRYARLPQLSVELGSPSQEDSPRAMSSIVESKSPLHDMPSHVHHAYDTDNRFYDSISEMLYGVIVRGKWSGNALLIAPCTFLSPRHLIGNVRDLNMQDVFSKYHSTERESTEDWAHVFDRCVLLVPTFRSCTQTSHLSKESGMLKVVATSRGLISQSDTMLMYAIPISSRSMPLVKHMKNSLKSKVSVDPASLFQRCLRSDVYPVVSLGNRPVKNDIVLIIWIDPVTNFRDFLDPTRISEWSFLHLYRDRPFRYSLCHVEDYIGHPQYFVQTCFTELSSSSFGLEILHSIRLIDFFRSHALYVETTSAGASGGLVFHVKNTDVTMDPTQRLDFIGIHIGKNRPSPSPNYAIQGKKHRDKVLGEFALIHEMLRNIPHPMECFFGRQSYEYT